MGGGARAPLSGCGRGSTSSPVSPTTQCRRCWGPLAQLADLRLVVAETGRPHRGPSRFVGVGHCHGVPSSPTLDDGGVAGPSCRRRWRHRLSLP
ncbi:hypothetical protein Scep_014413 [Stephania cephalantha]|uniref:Uncharacterized protein n=1 Tax=Stephania cephalantha TaxID=152367 RepID=A0AAP0J393_9MAGN